VAAHVVNQVLAGNAHEILANIAHVIGRVVVAHVGIDRGKPLGNRARALYCRLVDELYLQLDAVLPGRFRPFHDLERGTTGGHAAADDQNIDLFLDDFRIAESGRISHLSLP